MNTKNTLLPSPSLKYMRVSDCLMAARGVIISDIQFLDGFCGFPQTTDGQEDSENCVDGVALSGASAFS